MPISAKNHLRGKVVRVVPGVVTAQVEVDVNGNIVTGVITKDSLENLDIKEGDEITAVVKATSVMFNK